MAIWWEKICVTPPPARAKGVAGFDGDPEAMSKSIPGLWRINQNYHLLEVSDVLEYHSNGYFIHFASGDTVMRFKKELVTTYVAVRIGPEPVHFWIESGTGGWGHLTKTDFVYTPIRHTPVGDLTFTKELEAIRRSQQATFV